MTNLLASIVVTVVTNVTIVEPPRSPFVIVDGYRNGGFQQEPSEKTYVTTCKELTILRFEWRGKREIIEERILWQTNQVYKLDWVPK